MHTHKCHECHKTFTCEEDDACALENWLMTCDECAYNSTPEGIREAVRQAEEAGENITGPAYLG